MVQLVQLQQAPESRVDQVRIDRLRAMLGQRRSREVIEDACMEIIGRLARFELAYAGYELPAARRLALAIAAISDEVGLSDLRLAAQAAARCMAAADPAARGATAQRLLRVGEASLGALARGLHDTGG